STCGRLSFRGLRATARVLVRGERRRYLPEGGTSHGHEDAQAGGHGHSRRGFAGSHAIGRRLRYRRVAWRRVGGLTHPLPCPGRPALAHGRRSPLWRGRPVVPAGPVRPV